MNNPQQMTIDLETGESAENVDMSIPKVEVNYDEVVYINNRFFVSIESHPDPEFGNLERDWYAVYNRVSGVREMLEDRMVGAINWAHAMNEALADIEKQASNETDDEEYETPEDVVIN